MNSRLSTMHTHKRQKIKIGNFIIILGLDSRFLFYGFCINFHAYKNNAWTSHHTHAILQHLFSADDTQYEC